ncbi:GntR family transcriptional regulator [Alkalibacillus silvisoli]|uniref:GntR family transcriptional regulator n=1 Tax=Alkalibacillus silvisoli TaxID=392823 RepID=A0ABN0ZZA9_9BACI
MLIELDFESDIPIYKQLKNQIIEGIATKQVQPGDTLPSVRSLASDIGINLHTVNKVYGLLKQDEYIQIHRQKGAVINPQGIPEADDTFRSKLEQEMRPLIAESMCRGLDKHTLMQMCRQYFDDIQGE